MAIVINKGTEGRFSIDSPEELTAQLAEHLKSNISCTITNSRVNNGHIEGQLTDNQTTVRDIVSSIAALLQYELESDFADLAKWTLFSQDELMHYEQFGI